MMNKFVCRVGLFLVCLLLKATAIAQPQVITDNRPEIGYDIETRWCYGAPVFIGGTLFGNPNDKKHQPVLYTGHMTPRGMVILRYIGDFLKTPPEKQRVLRFGQADITNLLTITKVQYENNEGEAQTIALQDLPKLKVFYEPGLSKNLILPTEQGTCILLWQIGDEKTEWAEGFWRISLRFDAGPLNAKLTPHGRGVLREPKGIGTTLLYTFGFVAKKLETKEQRIEYLRAFKYPDENAKGVEIGYQSTLTVLNELIKKLPYDGQLLYDRANLLITFLGRKEDGLKEARELLRLAMANKLTQPVPAIGYIDGPVTQQERLESLRNWIDFWESQPPLPLVRPKGSQLPD